MTACHGTLRHFHSSLELMAPHIFMDASVQRQSPLMINTRRSPLHWCLTLADDADYLPRNGSAKWWSLRE
jgi:hypothetical protein